MEYGKIIAVTGMPGLFELLTSKTDGAIVRSLEDKSTKFVSSRVHNFSHLESIEVFTVRDNVNLIEIFHGMERTGDKAPDAKDASALKKYFEKVFPDLDFERVYTSDLKKMVKWYEVLKANSIEIKLTERQEDEEQIPEGVTAETVEDVKPVSTAKKKLTPEPTPATKAESRKEEKEVTPKKEKEKPSAAIKEKEKEEKPKKTAAKKKAAPKQKSKDTKAKTVKKTPAKKVASKKK